jgi:uncharacterized protein YbgA (DUF1722 family)
LYWDKNWRLTDSLSAYRRGKQSLSPPPSTPSPVEEILTKYKTNYPGNYLSQAHTNEIRIPSTLKRLSHEFDIGVKWNELIKHN